MIVKVPGQPVVRYLLENRHEGGYEILEDRGVVEHEGVKETERSTHHTGV
jgi:hypothetical protein